MSVKVAAWNVKRGLGNEYEGLIFNGLDQLNADVVVLSEAYSTNDTTPDGLEEDVIGRVSEFAERQGYDYIAQTPYQESGLRSPNESEPGEQTYLMVLGREVIKSANLIRLYNRDALDLNIVDQQTGISIQGIAAHFDDRHEYYRQKMTIDLISNLDPNRPSLLMGDLNAMNANSSAARLLRTNAARYIANHSFTERMKSITSRSIEMANGSILRGLEQYGFEDAARFGESTVKLAGIPFGRIDYIMVARSKTKNYKDIVAEPVCVRNFRGSDHKAISAVIRTNLERQSEEV